MVFTTFLRESFSAAAAFNEFMRAVEHALLSCTGRPVGAGKARFMA